MAVMTSSTFAPINSFIHKTALKVAEPLQLHEEFGMKISIPNYNSTTAKLRRYERFAPTTGAVAASMRQLTEGIVPSDDTLTATTVTITTAQYGFTARVSDVAIIANEIQPIPALQKNNAQNMAEVVDAVYRDGILAGTNYFRLTDDVGAVSGTNRTDVIGKINPVALDKAFRNLQLSDAPYWTDSIAPTTKINTAGVLPGYVAITHPYVYYDARQMAGWDEAHRVYQPTLKGEVGAYRNIRFVVSTMARVFADSGAAVSGTGKKSTTGTSADVYPVLVIGRESYACVKIADMARIVWIPPTQTDHLNPLGQYGTLGWKAMCGSGITNDNWILRVECAASA